MGALAAAEVTRGIAPPSAFPREPQEGEVSAISFNGEVVLIDTGDYRADGSDLSAILRWDGSIGLEYAKAADGRAYAGHRTGFYWRGRRRDDPPTNSLIHEGCVILGRVISRE